MMNVFFYLPVRDKREESNWKGIKEIAPSSPTDVFASTEDLAKSLCKTSGQSTIAVLYAARSEDLQALLLIKELLHKVYVLLILPDTKESTISKGHILRPRFLTFADSDLKDVGLVLTKMVETYGKKEQAEQ